MYFMIWHTHVWQSLYDPKFRLNHQGSKPHLINGGRGCGLLTEPAGSAPGVLGASSHIARLWELVIFGGIAESEDDVQAVIGVLKSATVDSLQVKINP